MKILLANYWLHNVGGTEKWTYAMACEMKRRGHDVTVFTLKTGITSDKIEEEGIEVIKTVPIGEKYDLQMINHNVCLRLLSGIPGYKVYTSHGPQHPLEEPDTGAHRYVAVSAEVRARYAHFNPVVIENGIDLTEFCPGPSDITDGKPVCLSMAKAGKATEMIEEACKRLGYVMMSVHYLDDPVWNMAPMIQAADFVIASGRSAYEALACDKRVFQFDWRDPRGGPLSDGWLTPYNIDYLRFFNCAGRGHAYGYDVEDLVEQLPWSQFGSWGRAWAQQKADIRQKAQSYLNLLEEYNGTKKS